MAAMTLLLIACMLGRGFPATRAAADGSPPFLFEARARDQGPVLEARVGTADEALRLVGSDEFTRTYWEQYPLHVHVRQDSHASALLEDVLSAAHSAPGGAVPVRLGPGPMQAAAACVALGVPCGAPVGRAEIRAALLKNHSVHIDETQRRAARLGQEAAALAKARRVAVRADAHLLPPGQAAAVAPRNELACAFVVQLAGRARWRLWKRARWWLAVDERCAPARPGPASPAQVSCRARGRERSLR
jgi:hypothetical protein